MKELVRILYMGTPDFAVPALDALYGAGVPPICVVTQPDRPRGRGHRLIPSPVKARAEELGLPVIQPESLRQGSEWGNALAKARPDLIVVCAYGKILPKDTLDAPRFGCVNIHASLLPKYRGAAPIHRAIEAGDRESGVTLMYMSEGMDEGDSMASRSVPIAGMNTGEATGVLAGVGAELLLDELPRIIGGAARREPQDDAAATYAPPVRKEEGHIDFSLAPDRIERKVRAMTPSPGAYAFLAGDKVKVWEARASARGADEQAKEVDEQARRPAPRPGEITRADGGVIEVLAARGGAVCILRLQSPGGKPMGAAEWLRGHSIAPGAVFE
jgi:methionyl-tRNA formyltransferase